MKKAPRVIYVFRFGKYPSTEIFYDLRFDSRNIRRRIFQNEYFSMINVICLQRLQKTEKLATENGYSKKKTHRPGTTRVHPKLEKNDYQKYTSVEQRHSLRKHTRGLLTSVLGRPLKADWSKHDRRNQS